MIPTINSERYSELLSQYQPRVVKTEEENEAFLAMVEDLMSRSDLSPEETAVLELLVKLIEAFEAEHYALNRSNPRSRLLHLMDAQSLEFSDLIPVLGSAEIVTEIAQGQSEINPEQALALGKFFQVNSTLFL